MPKSLVPALLLMTVRSFAPCWRRAAMRFSGIPHRPKPEIMMDAPSGTSRTASAASLTTLFMERLSRPARSADRAMIAEGKRRSHGAHDRTSRAQAARSRPHARPAEARASGRAPGLPDAAALRAARHGAREGLGPLLGLRLHARARRAIGSRRQGSAGRGRPV